MKELNYEETQAKIARPSRLCLHCGRCMPILDGENLKSSDILPNSIRGPICVWDEYPEECGYTGWLFWEREKQKHYIRTLKEEVHALSFVEDDMLVDKNKTAKQRKDELNSIITGWHAHNSANW